MAPSEAQRAGHLKKPLKFRSSEALKKIGAMAYALRHGSEAVITFAPPLGQQAVVGRRARFCGCKFDVPCSDSGGRFQVSTHAARIP